METNQQYTSGKRVLVNLGVSLLGLIALLLILKYALGM
jgi:hypothetical protein